MPDVSIDFRPIFNALETVNDNIALVSRDVDRIDTQVQGVSTDVRSTQDELKELRKRFDAYVEDAKRTAAVQRAETKVGNLKAEIDQKYGHYKVVRNTSVGLLQAFDVGNVSEATASQVSEELMIQTPRYWLAPALVGLAAWTRDDEEIARRSITEAYTRNQAKTALFFALVLRREKRDDDSVRWLRHYFASCDPRKLTREFAVILEAASQGQFGVQGTELTRDQLRGWTRELRSSQELVDQQVQKWRREIGNQRKVLAKDEAATLKDLVPPMTFNTLREQFEAPTALGRCAAKYQQILDSEFTATGTITSLLDDMLIQLVTEYDEEELPLRRDLAYQEAIIEADGDTDRARTKADQVIEALDEVIDAVTLQTDAALTPENLGVSVRTQQVAIGVGKEDFREAVHAYTRAYRAKHLANVPLTLEPDHHKLASAYGFVGMTTSTEADETTMANELRQAWEATFVSYIQKVSFNNNKMVVPIVIASVVTLFAFLLAWWFGFLIALIAGGGAYFYVHQQQTTAQKKVDEANRTKERAYAESLQMLVDARAEFDDLQFGYEDDDADEAELLRVIDVWPAGHAVAEEK